MSTIQIVGAVILAVSVLAGVGMKAWSWYKARPKKTYAPPANGQVNPGPEGPVVVQSSTDAPAPPGVGEYLSLIEKVADSATFQVWWEYAKKSLTEAAVLRAEVQRLTPKPPAKPAVPAEPKP